MNDTPETRRALQDRKLEQRCACGRTEAAGFYCTACARAMGPADWYPNGTRPLAPRKLPAGGKRGRPPKAAQSVGATS